MIRIYPPLDIPEFRVNHLPLSKSIAARVLILNELSGERNFDFPMPDCNDIEVLRQALGHKAGEIDVADSGTALRFLTALYAATEGADVTITGSQRLCGRPIAPLVESLRSLGASIEYVGAEGFAPLKIKGKKLRGGEVRLDAGASSQFASALAMVAPTMENGLRIDLGGQIPSLPYLQMTLRMLNVRGIDAHIEAYTVIVPEGKIGRVEPEHEPDWSSASYWYSIAAVSAGWVTLPGLKNHSLQGDSVLKNIGERFGVITEFEDGDALLSATPDVFSRLDMDMSDYPDLVPALAVTAALTGLPFVFKGVGNLRHKESDRLGVLAENLAKLGYIAEIGADEFGWEGERVPVMRMPQIEPHNDHRMAMAFAAASFVFPGIIIHEPECVSKSYPRFFDDLSEAGFILCGPEDPIPEEYQIESE